MTVALIDERMDSAAVTSLRAMGFCTLAMPGCSRLSEAVASHPDMLTLLVGDTLLVERRYFEENEAVFDKIKRLVPRLSIEPINKQFAEAYPQDCLLNALIIGGHMFCRSNSLATEAKQLAEECDLTVIDVKQGYPSCTVLAIGDSHAITSDHGMAKAMRDVGIDVLLIDNGGIDLPPYEYGFIGGASGVYSSKVYFIGDINTHPYGRRISDFCHAAGFEVISLSDGRLLDLGRIVFIDA